MEYTKLGRTGYADCIKSLQIPAHLTMHSAMN